jgi:hypothetical protein
MIAAAGIDDRVSAVTLVPLNKSDCMDAGRTHPEREKFMRVLDSICPAPDGKNTGMVKMVTDIELNESKPDTRVAALICLRRKY